MRADQSDAFLRLQDLVKGKPLLFAVVFPGHGFRIGKQLWQPAAQPGRPAVGDIHGDIDAVLGVKQRIVAEIQNMFLHFRINVKPKQPNGLVFLPARIGAHNAVALGACKKHTVDLGVQCVDRFGRLIKRPAAFGIGCSIDRSAAVYIHPVRAGDDADRNHSLGRGWRQQPGAQHVEKGQVMVVHRPVVFADGVFHHFGVQVSKDRAGVGVFVVPAPFRHIAGRQSAQLL